MINNTFFILNFCVFSDLWKKESSFYEQPTVFFLNELMIEVLDDDGVSYQYSTVKSIMDQCMNPLSQPTIKFSEFDNNSDGKKDRFWLKVNFKMPPQKVRNINLVAAFDYYLQSRLKMKMKGLIQLKQDTPLGVSFIKSSGQIHFKQQYPILIDSVRREVNNVDPLTSINFEQFNNDDIIDNYNARTETIEYRGNNLVQPQGSSFSTTIEMEIDVPRSQEVKYRPGVMETLKFAWI